jgi:hypothetical protein
LPWEVAKIIEKTSRLFLDHHRWWWVAHSLPLPLLLESRIFLPTTGLVPTPSRSNALGSCVRSAAMAALWAFTAAAATDTPQIQKAQIHIWRSAVFINYRRDYRP